MASLRCQRGIPSSSVIELRPGYKGAQETQVQSLNWEDPRRKNGNRLQYSYLRIYGQRSLVDHSPCHKEPGYDRAIEHSRSKVPKEAFELPVLSVHLEAEIGEFIAFENLALVMAG